MLWWLQLLSSSSLFMLMFISCRSWAVIICISVAIRCCSDEACTYIFEHLCANTLKRGNLSFYFDPNISSPLPVGLSFTSLYTSWSFLWSVSLAGPGSVKFPSGLTNVFQLESDMCTYAYDNNTHKLLEMLWPRNGCCLERSYMQLLHGRFFCDLHPFPLHLCPSLMSNLPVSLSPLFYGLHVFTVSLGRRSALLPQSIGYGWLANRSSTTLKKQSVRVARVVFTGCHSVLNSPTLRILHPRSG